MTAAQQLGSTKRALGPGAVLGRYRLLKAIGAGGMGRVWVAAQVPANGPERLFAVKTALAENSASTEAWKAMLDEANIASQVQHPNVCRIHTFDQEAGVAYLVMDYCDGGSLRDLLDAVPGRRLAGPIGARITANMLAGLHAAHELTDEDGHSLGVVHRDVSPQNVLLGRKGRAMLIDFGVARARGQHHAATQTGELKGKLSYMAPEQVTSKNVDRRADIFAAGCVLYEATVGARPFDGVDALSTMYQILEQNVKPPSELRPDYPLELEAIVMKALARSPDARFATADEMGRELESFLSTSGARTSEADVAQVIEGAFGPKLSERAQELVTISASLKLGKDGALSITAVPIAAAPPAKAKARVPWGAGAAFVAALGIAAVAFALKRSEPRPGPEVAPREAESVPPIATQVSGSTRVVPTAEPPPSVTAPPASAVAPPPSGPRPGKRPPAFFPVKGPPSVNPTVTSPQSSAPSPSLTLPGVSKKPPRALDPENPFATP